MNPVTIKIESLGGIRDSLIRLSPVMLFLGESGLGKSYTAMLCHYIYELILSPRRLSRFFLERGLDFNQMRPSWQNSGIAIDLSKRDLEEWLARDAVEYLRDMVNHPQLEAKIQIHLPQNDKKTFQIKFEEVILGLVNEEEVYINLTLGQLTYTVKSVGVDEESPFSLLVRYVLAQDIWGDYKAISSSYILPPGRAIQLTEEVSPVTGLYRRYANWLRVMPYLPELDVRYPKLDKIIYDVIQGKIERQDDKFIYITDLGVEMPVSASASSVRELAPLAYLIGKRDIKTCSLLFEEPEAHLHPGKQRKMADVISHLKLIGTHMQITTHSDYLLRRLNELLQLDKIKMELIKNLGEDEGKQRFVKSCIEEGIDSEVTLSPEGLSAYYFCREEGRTKIISETDFSTGGISFKTFFSVLEEDLNKKQVIDNWLDILKNSSSDDQLIEK